MSGALTFDTHGPEETQDLGRLLGAGAQVGDLFLLEGSLGAGKTTLAQGIAWGAGVTGYAHSPTFVIVHEYAGRIPLYHVDLYRIEEGNLEAHDLGIEDMLADGACMVEWSEKAPAVFSADPLHVAIAFGDGPDDRHIAVTAASPRYASVLSSLRTAAAR
ncbi:MAG: tRNA (adenosine(37)-N6)-threonylcarbamoyltransferase complex ATPase subunit type 1 TsaE [Chloroflexi bacterium]|nr:tRNA (adenosine(37)-N6)-threonylcarbamoyltransferase complex ATPase subunit type 1 TsaE [Chloroflexota bacterium]